MGAARLLIAFFNERDPRGGRVKAFLFLTHPGPSLLVTAVTVAALALLERAQPNTGDLVRAALLMLGAQVAIGCVNDWADAGDDEVAKPYKPIPRGAVSDRAALLIAVGAGGVSLATGISWGGAPALAAVLGLGAGISYDIALQRTPYAVVCWWAGFAALLTLVTSVSGAGGLVQTLPLAVLIATALLLANGLPDADDDTRADIPSLTALLGDTRARAVLAAALLVAAALSAVVWLGNAVDPPAPAASVVLVMAAGAATLPRRAVFPVTALLCALAGLLWFAGLPTAT